MSGPKNFSNCTSLEYSCVSEAKELDCLSMALAQAATTCSQLDAVVIKLDWLLGRWGYEALGDWENMENTDVKLAGAAARVVTADSA